MKIVITGGGGFLGSMLARRLLRRGQLAADGQTRPIDQIVLLDTHFATTIDDPRVTSQAADISDADAVHQLVRGNPGDVAVFHLASMVSGECEQRFDDALRVNLDGGRNILQAVRALGGCPRLVFASSIACFGGDPIPPSFSDQSKLLPGTTYGMTKAILELMVNDYTRKGFIDGRSARLPTVIIRPGQPNAAASSWASGMFREPLNGQSCLLPVHRDQPHPMTGYRTVIESLIALYELPSERLGGDRAVGLPAHRVTPQLAEQVLSDVGKRRRLELGQIVDAQDAAIQRIVDGWPVGIEAARALALGLPEPPPLAEIVQQYLDDFAS